MRHALPIVAAAALAVAITPLAGCFVLDELEAGEKIMDAHSPKRNKKAKEAAADASGEKSEDEKPAGQAWWSQARSLGRGPTVDADDGDPDALVRCELGGTTRFMRRGDCLSQGGRLASR